MILRAQVILFVSLAVQFTQCSRILGIFPMAAVSHNILASKLMKGLAEAGHDVTVVSPFTLKEPPKNGTYTDIVLDGFSEEFDKKLENFNFMGRKMISPLTMFAFMSFRLGEEINKTLEHPSVKKLVASQQKFDLVITEYFLNDALYVYGHLFNCPVVALNSIGPNSWVNSQVGNPQPPSYVAHRFNTDFVTNLSFLQRIYNTFLYIAEYFIFLLRILPQENKYMQQAYPNSPSIYELRHNVSLILLNSHTSYYESLPVVPNMIEIGGYFIDPPKELPRDLKEHMDNATDGVVYFSLGSNIKSKNLPPERKRMLLNIFGRLKQKVIWKFEEDLEDKPDNVLIRKWCPQQDILAHPNIKLFISHGGLLSVTETIYHGVPILAIPIFADQPVNAARAKAQGFGLQLAYSDPDFTEEKLEYLIHELLNNPEYFKKAKERSALFHDRPMKPMETAVYWIEYVIRHGGAPHLRVAGAKLPWYKYFMVDVVAFLASIMLISVYVLKIAIRTIFRSKAKKLKVN